MDYQDFVNKKLAMTERSGISATPRAFVWTDETDDLVRQCYQPPTGTRRLTKSVVAGLLGIARSTVWYRAKFLGLSIPKKRNRFSWNPAEDEILEKHAHLPIRNIRLALQRNGSNRTELSIRDRLRALGIKKRSAAVDNGYYTTAVLAECLGIKEGPIKTWISTGLLPAKRQMGLGHRDHGVWIIRESDVREFLVNHTVRIAACQPDIFWLVDILRPVTSKKKAGDTV